MAAVHPKHSVPNTYESLLLLLLICIRRRLCLHVNNLPESKLIPSTMSGFFPHTAYAEDQPLAQAILITHCLHRGFTVGSIAGAGIGSARSVFQRKPFLPTLLRSTGVGGLVGMGVLALGVTGRMWGKEEIEWKDRAWRLCENKGQVAVDNWSLSGMGVGATVVGLGMKGLGWKGVLGGAALGSIVGTLGCMGMRRQGKGKSKGTGEGGSDIPSSEGGLGLVGQSGAT